MRRSRSFAFYVSAAPAPDRQAFRLPTGGLVYLRAEAFDLNDEDALDRAMPRADESVMNSHTFQVER